MHEIDSDEDMDDPLEKQAQRSADSAEQADLEQYADKSQESDEKMEESGRPDDPENLVTAAAFRP